MKKRILGLLLALCLVVGLLPMAALAEDPKPEVRFNYVVPGTSTYVTMNAGDAPIYWKTGNFKAAEPNTFYMSKIDAATAAAEGWNVKLEYPADGIPTMTLKNAKIVEERTICFVGEGSSTGSKAYDGDVKLIVEGDNYISCDNPYTADLFFNVTGNAIIEGPGILKIEHKLNSYTGGLIHSKGGIVLNGVNLDLDLPYAANRTANAIYAQGGSITVKDSAVDIVGWNPLGTSGSLDGASWTARRPICAAFKATGDLSVEGSVIRAVGSACNSGTNGFINLGGKFSVKDSDIVLATVNGTYLKVFDKTKMPTEITASYAGGYSVITSATKGTYDPATDTFNAPAEDKLKVFTDISEADLTAVNFLMIVHTHNASSDNDCTTDDVCTVCGAVMTPKKDAHAGTSTDCTKDTMCTNPGCTKVAIPAKAAHNPETDDGDCTTAIKCADCGTVTTAAEAAHTGGTATCTKKAECAKCGKEYGDLAKHTYTRPDCSVDSICSVCNQVAVPAGQHTGGTATCQAKAKCQDCGQEYGELGACAGGTATCKEKAKCATCGKEYGELSKEHKPAVDDGNCTTAIKCSLCGAETTAAKAAHTYTDNNDDTCNTAGCTFKRTIEKPDAGTNGSAKTGDVSVLIAAGMALASAVSVGGITVLRKKNG